MSQGDDFGLIPRGRIWSPWVPKPCYFHNLSSIFVCVLYNSLPNLNSKMHSLHECFMSSSSRPPHLTLSHNHHTQSAHMTTPYDLIIWQNHVTCWHAHFMCPYSLTCGELKSLILVLWMDRIRARLNWYRGLIELSPNHCFISWTSLERNDTLVIHGYLP